MEAGIFSRPARLGSRVVGMPEEAVADIFAEKRILVRLEEPLCELSDAQAIFVFAVNQALRFCPNVSICIERDLAELARTCGELAVQVHGAGAVVEVVQTMQGRAFDAIVNVGTKVFAGAPSATVNSSGWVARLATGDSGTQFLAWRRESSNPLGGLAAACLGVGAAFLAILKIAFPVFMETSLFTYESGLPGTLELGPALPKSRLRLDAFLVGCGAVSNGWAYTVKRLPIVGSLQAIDRQSLRLENLGPYVLSGRSSIGKSKASLIKEVLSPSIEVADRADQWEFFKIRLRKELKVPPLIVAGLDNVATRHSVQRLWPDTLIDMAAGGLESQGIVKHSRGDGQCLLNALSGPAEEANWAQSVAEVTGLDPELIARDPTGEITQAEIEDAPRDKKAELRASLGKPRCGHINRHTLELEDHDPHFAPAVPFVTAFSGVVGAAETMKWLMGKRYVHTVHLQKSFRSGQMRCLEMKCDPDCECQRVQG